MSIEGDKPVDRFNPSIDMWDKPVNRFNPSIDMWDKPVNKLNLQLTSEINL
jgi:hypothetical protein